MSGIATLAYKFAIILAVTGMLVTVSTALPIAEPLPQSVTAGINWFFSKLYFFNEILDIPTFFLVTYYAIRALLYYFVLKVVIMVLKWAITI